MAMRPRRGDGGGAAGLALVVALAACGSRPPARPRHDGGDAGARGGAVTAGVADAGDAGEIVADVAGGGTVAVTVSWPDAPAAVRRSPGVTACGTPRRPRATIAALHGVAGVVVMLEGVPGGSKRAWSPSPVRLAVRDCAVEPPVAVVPGLPGTLEVQSQDDAAHEVAIADVGPGWTAPASEPQVTRARLPVWGHTVALALPAAGVHRVVADGAADAAFVVVSEHPHVAVTAADGTATLDGVPPGTYGVVAWLPPAAGAPATVARGEVTVVGGDRVDLTLRLDS